MSNIATTIEQSKHLLELGLDPATADMYYPIGSSIPDVCCEGDNLQADNVCWSFDALWKLVSKEYIPELQTLLETGQCYMYAFFGDFTPCSYVTKSYDSPVTAAYEMVCWMIERGFIKKGGEDGRD